MHACRYITNTEWISGSYDGSVALWSQLKKKPISLHRGVHATGQTEATAEGPGSPNEEAAGWVQSVAVCPQSDLAVRTIPCCSYYRDEQSRILTRCIAYSVSTSRQFQQLGIVLSDGNMMRICEGSVF